MAEKVKKLSPPYATFPSFVSFINKLRDTGVPPRIDASVFGNASGSITYSVIAALKYLKLIDDSGAPSPEFRRLVVASDEERKPMLAAILRKGYPTLFEGDLELGNMTAGQFDEHFRDDFDVKGSTIDKIAAFFLSAAAAADIPLSVHLKGRKSIAASSSSRKGARQRKRENGETLPPPQQPPSPAPAAKPLEYQLIDLMSEPDIEDDVKQSIWNLVQYLAARKAKKTAATGE